MKATIQTEYKGQIPEQYLKFLKQNPDGDEIQFDERDWELFGEKELLEKWEMKGVGEAANFECLKLYIKLQREYSISDRIPSNVGEISLARIQAGLVIGSENGDYIYMDPADNFSVWAYHHDGGDVERLSDSFETFLGADQ